MAKVITENCPNCMTAGKISILEIDEFDETEIYFYCPVCLSKFTESELNEIYRLPNSQRVTKE